MENKDWKYWVGVILGIAIFILEIVFGVTVIDFKDTTQAKIQAIEEKAEILDEIKIEYNHLGEPVIKLDTNE
jgi:hypothetical protein